MKKIWEYHSTGQIIFGVGAINKINKVLEKMKVKNVLLITDPAIKKLGFSDRIVSVLKPDGFKTVVYDNAVPEPPITSVLECVEFAKAKGVPDAIIALGGGSSIDLAKSTSIILTHGGHPSDYVGEDLVPGPIIPLISIPTTAGTGSEVTSVSVLTDIENNLKVGISDNYLRSMVAILDPELTIGLPPYITACSGIDALSHAIEAYTAMPYTNIEAKGDIIFQGSLPLSDTFALKAIELIANNIKLAVHQGDNLEARSNMMLGSLLAGLALSNTGTAAAHAAAYPIGGLVKSPHGEVTGLLLPYVMEYNASINSEKMISIAKAFNVDVSNLNKQEAALEASKLVLQLLIDIGLPTKLSQIGIHEKEIPMIAQTTLTIDRIIRNNPRIPTQEDFEELLMKAL